MQVIVATAGYYTIRSDPIELFIGRAIIISLFLSFGPSNLERPFLVARLVARGINASSQSYAGRN